MVGRGRRRDFESRVRCGLNSVWQSVMGVEAEFDKRNCGVTVAVEIGREECVSSAMLSQATAILERVLSDEGISVTVSDSRH